MLSAVGDAKALANRFVRLCSNDVLASRLGGATLGSGE
jgi:hypothetical protein